MVKRLSLILILIFSLTFGAVSVSASSDEASYYGGTVATFKDAKKQINGHLLTKDETNLQFKYGKDQMVTIPYASFIDIEYGQKSGRRVGMAVATTI